MNSFFSRSKTNKHVFCMPSLPPWTKMKCKLLKTIKRIYSVISFTTKEFQSRSHSMPYSVLFYMDDLESG